MVAPNPDSVWSTFGNCCLVPGGWRVEVWRTNPGACSRLNLSTLVQRLSVRVLSCSWFACLSRWDQPASRPAVELSNCRTVDLWKLKMDPSLDVALRVCQGVPGQRLSIMWKCRYHGLHNPFNATSSPCLFGPGDIETFHDIHPRVTTSTTSTIVGGDVGGLLT